MRASKVLLTSAPAQVVPVFAGGLDFSLPVRKFFYDPLGSGKAYVNAVVSLTGFALVGGPARQDAPKVRAQALDTAPVMPAVCLSLPCVTCICMPMMLQPPVWTHGLCAHQRDIACMASNIASTRI